MAEPPIKTALIALRWTLGVVIFIEASLFVMPGSHHDFARTHMPDFIRLVLGCGEIIGAILLLIPRTVTRGAGLLAAVFLLAIVVHLVQGMYNVGNLLVYVAAAWVLAAGR
jgi:uncharacterized membrane protein YphA (DoxX/SURF4 family)